MTPTYDEQIVIIIQSHWKGYLARKLYQLKKSNKQRQPDPILQKKVIIFGNYCFNVTVAYSKTEDCFIVKGSSGTYFTYIESLIVPYKKLDLDSYGPHTSKTKRLASILLNYVSFINNYMLFMHYRSNS